MKIKLQTLTLSALLLCLLCGCGPDEMMVEDETGIDCNPILALVPDTEITSEVSEVCMGDTVRISITSYSEGVVTYSDGMDSQTIEFASPGTEVLELIAAENINYSLESILIGECEKEQTGTVSVAVSPPPSFEVNIIGTWSVTNQSDGSSGGMITFNADGTGTATEMGAFSESDFFDQEFSTDFEWVFNSNNNRLGFTFLFDGIDTVRTDDMLENDCDEVVIRNNQTDGDTHVLVREG